MKTYRCVCGNELYFENYRCLGCGRDVGFLPDRLELLALQPEQNDLFRPLAENGKSDDGGLYRKCLHYSRDDACNWMVPADDQEPFCKACRLNEIIPNLDKPGNRALWLRVEHRKRRLVADLLRHGLPVVPRSVDPEHGLAFAFLEDDPGGLEFNHTDHNNRILTGHANGLITINIAEADDVERERMRVEMNEQQRTLLGHFRHESGHYYWDRLVVGSPEIDEIRSTFGDERSDYASAIESYYSNGPRFDWPDSFVSAYASLHPFEDWAECWAHWLQIHDTLETAMQMGLSAVDAQQGSFDRRIKHWLRLAAQLNLLNRSLDQPDSYPFVLTPPVIDKLRCVDQVIARVASH